MKRACESCRKQAATRRVKARGVAFLVCSGCAPTIPARRRRVA